MIEPNLDRLFHVLMEVDTDYGMLKGRYRKQRNGACPDQPEESRVRATF